MWSPCLLVKMKLVSVVNKLKTGNRSRETDTCHLREFRSGPGREVAAVWLARPAAPSAASRRDKRPTLAVSPPRGAEHRSRGVGRAGPVCGLRGGARRPGLVAGRFYTVCPLGWSPVSPRRKGLVTLD